MRWLLERRPNSFIKLSSFSTSSAGRLTSKVTGPSVMADLQCLHSATEMPSAKVVSVSAEAPMKRLAIVGAVLLLAGPAQAFWADKRKVCATWSARQMSDREAAKKLGMKPDSASWQIGNFCDFYKR